VSSVPEEDPLDYVDMDDVLQHGDPGKWRFLGPKKGSPAPATSPKALPGTTKHYDLYEDEFGEAIELHYFRHSDGSVGDVKVKR
jgi:hypothetical protein